jgi:hypothetical protein
MRIAVVVGNGLSISRAHDARISLSPSKPFSIDPRHPGRNAPLIASLPHLRDWLATPDIANQTGDFAKILQLIASLPSAPSPYDLPTHLSSAMLDLRHYLTLAYSEYQLQLDRVSMEKWHWRRWFEEQRKSIAVALSWNYDLVLERIFQRTRTRFHYVGAGGWPEWDGRGVRAQGIPLTKPHGSCNFAIDGLSIRSAESDGGPTEALGYPRAIEVSTIDGPLTALSDRSLLTVRQSADIVLPGEVNVFGPYLRWIRLTQNGFKRAVASCDILVVIGFQMAAPDEQEFITMLSWALSFKQVVVADPTPSPALLDLLAARSPNLRLWLNGPERL